jgi:hypothetical protein
MDLLTMPYKSPEQRAYMKSHLPKLAAKWDKLYGKGEYKGQKPPSVEDKAAFKYGRKKKRR